MAVHRVLVNELLSRIVEVEADTASDAVDRVTSMWEDEDLVLTGDDFYDVEFEHLCMVGDQELEVTVAENKAAFIAGIADLLRKYGNGRYDALGLEYFIEHDREYVQLTRYDTTMECCSVDMDSLTAMLVDIGPMLLNNW